MKMVFFSICAIGMALTVIPTGLKFYGAITDTAFKAQMLAGTICWFVGATALIAGRKKNNQ